MKMKVIMEAAILRFSFPNLLPKNSGIVAVSRCWVMILVRLPRIRQAIREPIRALPIPIQVDAIPYFQPNCPAYPTKITAEK